MNATEVRDLEALRLRQVAHRLGIIAGTPHIAAVDRAFAKNALTKVANHLADVRTRDLPRTGVPMQYARNPLGRAERFADQSVIDWADQLLTWCQRTISRGAK